MSLTPYPAVQDDDHDHDKGFSLDRHRLLLPATMTRRRALGLFAAGAAGVGAALVLPGAAAGAATTASTTPTPGETAGPYPGDGSNGPDVLDDTGVVRRDIRSSFGTASGTTTGVGLRLSLQVVDAATSAPMAGAAVYAWHCDRLGRYSLYSSGVTAENWLRGVQVTNAKGILTFVTNFPGCYSGRYPHVHFEVYPSRADAVAASNRLLTSQLALPSDACSAVYGTSGYESSRTTFAGTSLATDSVFGDGWSRQLATVKGSTTAGYRATLVVAI